MDPKLRERIVAAWGQLGVMEILFAAIIIPLGGLALLASIVMSRKRNIFLFLSAIAAYIVAVYFLADFLLRTTQHTWGSAITISVVMVAAFFLGGTVIGIVIFSLLGKPPHDS
jgi:hypothetical protein